MSQRMLTQKQLCDEILGVHPRDFRRKRDLLEANGFPQPHPVLNRYDRHAVDRYFDKLIFAEPECEPQDDHDADAALDAIVREAHQRRGVA